MAQVLKIAKKEIKTIFREKIIIGLSIMIFLLLGVAITAGYLSYQQQRDQKTHAQQEKREQWLNQGEKHPHIAAHFGTFIFKPKTFLSFLDFGLDAYTGTSVYLEAHFQHEFMFRPAQSYNTMIRFGELSAALVLQILVPLLIIFLCFSSFTKEKEDGTLKLLISQGVSFKTIAWGKITAIYLIISFILIPVLGAFGFYIWHVQDQYASLDLIVRILLLIGSYAVYIFLFIGLGIVISAHAYSSRNALLALLTFWIVFTIIIPKTAANLGKSIYPLPSMKVYKEAIAHDVKQGLDGKSTRDVRLASLKDKYLEKYGVDSVHHLPINFEGISMQAGEDYGNKVYDVHWGRLTNTVQRQNRISAYLSLINPYLAVRNISMGLAATDFHTTTDFQRKVEAYRREFVERMNMDMAKNSKYGEFYEYKSGADLWKEIKDFSYFEPSWKASLKEYQIEAFSLFLWLCLIICLIHFSVNNVKLIRN